MMATRQPQEDRMAQKLAPHMKDTLRRHAAGERVFGFELELAAAATGNQRLLEEAERISQGA